MAQPIPFGKYYLLDRINVGGMAEVFRAKAVGVEGFERVVAVKRILPSIAEDQEFITMFIDEAKIAVQLTHANIAQIFDLGRVDDSYFIALEYVHGKDLRAIFNRARSRGAAAPIALGCYAMMKVCEGLDYAHNKRDPAGQFLNLVHRDVSPQNILISYEGEVKIIDFGIAKAAGKASNTQTGILKGKFGYMSPEQAHGAEIDRRSDLFAVGICLYEMITGERAFLGETDLATLDNVRNVNLTAPRVHNPAIPEQLETIVLKALRPDPEQRYQTAQQFQQALSAFLRSLPAPVFDRRDLSAYMRAQFAEELAKESTREREAAASDEAEDDEVSGLAVFDRLAPQEMAPEIGDSALGRPHRAQYKTTLHGLPALLDETPRGPSTLRPRPVSVPPPARARQSTVPPPPPAMAPRVGGGEIEWDEEELSTQIYDPPEDRVAESAENGGVRPSWTPAANTGAASVRTLSGRPPPQASAPPLPSIRPRPGTLTQVVVPGAAAARSARIVLLSVGAAVLLLIAFLWVFRAPPTGAVELHTRPLDATVRVDGRVVAGQSPFVVGELTADTPHTVSVQKHGYRAWSSRVQPREGETLRLPAVELEPLESGFALDSVPSGASVFVNGARLEQSTPVRVATLPPGDHRIRVEAQGYAPWESSVKVTPGLVLDLPVAQLIARSAEVPRRVAAPDPDGSAQAVTTPALVIDPPTPRVAQRRPVAAASASGVADPGTNAAAAARTAPRPRPKAAESSEAPGTLRIQTKPWSTVLLDGRAIGTTPLMNVPVQAGKHTLTFVNDEFGIRRVVTIQIQPGQVSTQVLDLTR